MELQTFFINATALLSGNNILDAHRKVSTDMLESTKIPTIVCFKAVGEGIANITKELDVLKATLTHLSAPLGLSFF